MASYWFRCVFRFFQHIKEIKENYELPCEQAFSICEVVIRTVACQSRLVAKTQARKKPLLAG